jgi:hypothetical protein
MSTLIENRQPTNPSSLGHLVARHPVVAFLLMAYTFVWTIQFAAFQLGLPLRLGSSIAVIFGMALPAFLVTAAMSGRAGVGDLLRRALRWRVGVRWYLIRFWGFWWPRCSSRVRFSVWHRSRRLWRSGRSSLRCSCRRS